MDLIRVTRKKMDVMSRLAIKGLQDTQAEEDRRIFYAIDAMVRQRIQDLKDEGILVIEGEVVIDAGEEWI